MLTGRRAHGVAVSRSSSLRPFLKWAGGKGQLLAQFEPLLPRSFARYLEPFLGSGALFFHLQPAAALLNDANGELINTWECIRDRLEELVPFLERHRQDHGREHYLRTRELDPGSLGPAERAARFLYLNKTCFNGLHRVNRSGRFNVPMGRYARPAIPSAADLALHARVLASASLFSMPYDEFARSHARRGDFVYLDPPYVPASPTANFTAYGAGGFGVGDQERLRDLFAELDSRGCFLMLSNSDTPLVRELYAPWAKTTTIVSARRSINSRGQGRGAVHEVVVRNRLAAQ